MIHPLYDVTDFETVDAYTLRVYFDDGTQQVINFEPVLYGEMYGPLRDVEIFNQVALHPELCTLVWPNGADFNPWTLHEWPQLADKLSRQARSWELELTPAL